MPFSHVAGPRLLPAGAFRVSACYVRRMPRITPLTPRERMAAVQRVIAMKEQDAGLPPNQRRTMSQLADDARLEILKERA